VSKVLVGARNGYSEEATFEMKNSLEKPCGDVIVDPESMTTYLKAAHVESDDGELEITISSAIQEAVQAVDPDDEAGMVIRVVYELVNPSAGLFFVLPHESSYPNRPQHMYSHNLSGPRAWMPCLDTSFDRCRWVLEFEVTADLTVVASGVAPNQPQDILSKDNTGAHASNLHLESAANSFGGLSSATTSSSGHSKDISLKKYTFIVSQPVIASSIGFAVGKFESVSDATLPGKLTFYNLLGRSSLLANTVGFMAHSLEYFEALLHCPLPAKHLKIVFVDDAPTKVHATAGLIICSTHLLHSQDVIDQAYATRKAISIGLAMQWFPTLVCAQTVADSWIISGIVGYLAYVNYQKMFGQSEFRSAVLSDLNYVLQGTRLAKRRKSPALFSNRMDDLLDNDSFTNLASFVTSTLFTQLMRDYSTHPRYTNDPEPVDFSAIETLGDAPFLRDALLSDFDSPLYFSNFITSSDVNTKYYYKRSTLVMLQLEKMVGTEIMRQLLELLVRPDENTGQPAQQQLTASKFFKICKKSVSHKNFVKFPVDWVYQQGIPHLHVGFQYHADSRKTEFVIKQDTSYCNVVLNPLTIRVHAARSNNGNSLASSTSSGISAISSSTLPMDNHHDEDQDTLTEEHQVILEGAYQTFFTKSKMTSNQPEKAARKKRRLPASKKSSKMDDDETDDEDDDDFAGPDGADLRMARARSDLGWIRVDPDFEWIRYLSFKQPEYMWIAQLENDRDVLAQFEGIDGLLHSSSSDMACMELNRILSNPQNFFKVRMRAACALGIMATRFPRAYDFLQRFFLENYYDQPEPARNARRGVSTSTTTTATNNSAVSTPGLGLSSASTHHHPPSSIVGSSAMMAVDTPMTPATNSAQQQHYAEDDQEPTLRPNDFSDFESYFVQKAVVHAIATIRDFKNSTPAFVLKFLMDLLDSNDNSRNAYSDNYYVASLIHTLSFVRSENQADYLEMAKQIERYLGKERMMPCFHNVIAQACLHLLATLQANGHLDVEINAFKPYFSYGNFPSVRAVAIRCYLRLALCVAQTDASFDDAFNRVDNIMRNDPSIWFKHKTAFALATALQSGANLDLLFHSPKANHWRMILFSLINSNVTSYSPRVRLLLLSALATIGGEQIATAPKLPPRKLYPTHPPKASHLSSPQNEGTQGQRKKNAKRGFDQISTPLSAYSPSHQTPSHGQQDHPVISSPYESSRPQRKAAARAKLTEPDPIEEALNSSFFVVTKTNVNATTNTTNAHTTVPTPTEDVKPRKFVFSKAKLSGASTSTATSTPTPTTHTPVLLGSQDPTPAVPITETSNNGLTSEVSLPPLPSPRPSTMITTSTMATEPIITTTSVDMVPVSAVPSTKPTPAELPSSVPGTPSVAPKRPVFKVKTTQPTAATPSAAPASTQIVETTAVVGSPTRVEIQSSLASPESILDTSPPATTPSNAMDVTVAATPKASLPKFVFKKKVAAATEESPTPKKMKLEDE
jgi:hypothetical protein